MSARVTCLRARRSAQSESGERARIRPIFEPSFVLDCIFKFALNFRPQSIFLRDRGEAFVIVRLTSPPRPILEVLCGFAKGFI